jgi:hypothetical protein
MEEDNKNKQSTLKELLDFHEKFVLGLPKCKTISPQICVSKNNEVTAIIIIGGRDEIKAGMLMASASKPDWIVEFNEMYFLKVDVKTEEGKEKAREFMKIIEHGDLEREFKKGNKNIAEGLIIQAYKKEGKLMRVIDKYTGKQIGEDGEEFDGYLTVNDVDRIYW